MRTSYFYKSLTFRRYIILLATIFFIAAGIIVAPKPTYACSCVEFTDVLEHRDAHDAVFKGTVVSENKKKGKGFISSASTYKTTFEVSEVWRGKVTSSITVLSAISEASCGYIFEEGKTYLVYAKLQGSDLHVSLCSRTAPIDMAGEDLSLLGSGSTPPDLSATDTKDADSSNAWIWIFSIIMLMTAFVIVLIIRQTVRSRKV